MDEKHIRWGGSKYRKMKPPKRYYYEPSPERRRVRMLYMRRYREIKRNKLLQEVVLSGYHTDDEAYVDETVDERIPPHPWERVFDEPILFE